MKYLLLCVFAAFCATFSLSNGNLVWPLLVLAALLLRLRLAAVVTILVAASVAIFAFFYHYTVYLKPTTLHSRDELVGLLKYVAAYFGSSWATSDVRLAEVLGILGFLVLGLALWQMPAYFRVAPAICIQFGFLLLFALPPA